MEAQEVALGTRKGVSQSLRTGPPRGTEADQKPQGSQGKTLESLDLMVFPGHVRDYADVSLPSQHH